MTHQSHLFLQGEDKLYINFGSGLSRLYTMCEQGPAPCDEAGPPGLGPQCDAGAPSMLGGVAGPSISSSLVENKQWHVVSLPATYAATNWPIRLAAIDSEGKHLAVAGRCGIAHYSLLTRKWKLFGNETQEKDMVVFGGLLWFARSWIVLGCYSIPTEADELRFYPKEARLSNESMISVPVSGQVCLLENLRNRILTFTSDCRIYIYNVEETGNIGLDVTHIQSIDVSGLCVHPACIVSITLTTILPEPHHRSSNNMNHRHPSSQSPGRGKDSFVMNVSGRLLLVNQFDESQEVAAPTVLASNVETVWAPSPSPPTPRAHRPHLTQALWLYCGVQGMRVWLPLFPRQNSSGPPGGAAGAGGPGGSQYSNHHHSFISKRIMLPFHLNVYPLGILYEEAILLGVENDAALYSTADPRSVFSLPFSLLKRTSQVYIHQILRQLIRRNLGYHAWEIARACTSLPYFPHSLELLLHEVLEEEATSKEPIPDAQLPSVIEFIQEFPVYLSTIVQCARKTEIALWGYLFAAAGKPKDLFQQCLTANELETAASYLIILQNLETSSVSRQYATLLLDATLDAGQWDLAKDLVRFLRAIDPNDIESPRTSVIHHNYKYGALPGVTPLTPSLTPNEEDLSMLLGTMQVSRARSYSTTNTPKIELQPMLPNNSSNTRHADPNKHETSRTRKRSSTSNKSDKEAGSNGAGGGGTAEDFFMDLILQRHARRLLVNHELKSFGHFAATLDFHLVEWLLKERTRAARVDSFIVALKNLHSCFAWPYPNYSTDWVLGGGGGGGGSATAMSRHASLSSMRSTSPPASPDEPMFRFGPLGIKHSDTPLPGLLLPAPGSIIDDSGYMSQNPVLQAHSGGYVPQDARSLLSDDTITNSYYPAAAVTGGPASPSSYRGECEESVPPWLSPPPWLSGGGEDEGAGGRGEETQQHHHAPGGGREWTVAIPCTQVLDALSKQMTSRGSPKAEVQLRYLLQIFTEAGCLEWMFIIAVLLRDAMAIHRISNAARSLDQSYESVLLLKEGFVSLCRWSHSECLGYKPFFVAVQAQLSILNKVLLLKQPPLSSASPLLSSSPPTTSSMLGGDVDQTGLPLLSSSPETEAASGGGHHGNKKPVVTGAGGSGHATSGECKTSVGAEQGEGELDRENETPSVCVVS
uniref:Protein RIC1 homolog n=1 Tax=Cacopsylla melanoneura TaxID=428564 RepID=A0A8D9BXZ7_9HEMI